MDYMPEFRERERWQHIRPDSSHTARYLAAIPNPARTRANCASCGKPIYKVTKNAGPEALRELFPMPPVPRRRR